MNQSSKDLLQRATETTAFEELELNYTDTQLSDLIIQLSECSGWGEVTEVLINHQEQLIGNF